MTVSFTDVSTNTPTSWKWDFGDGSQENDTTQNPVHTFASPGIYTVSLKATNADGSNTLTKPNYITVFATTYLIAPDCEQINGVQYTAPSTGFYHVNVTGSYNPWPDDHADSWTSGVYIYKNRPVEWAPIGWGRRGCSQQS